MMNSKIRFIFLHNLVSDCLILVIPVLFSCQSGLWVVRSLPPEILLEDDQHELYMISLFDTATVDFNQEKKEQVYVNAYRHYVKSLENEFREELGFDIHFPGEVGSPEFTFVDSLIVSLFNQSEIPYILVMEAFGLERIRDMEVYEKDDGSKSRTAIYSLAGNSVLALYAFPGRMLDRSRIIQSLVIKERQVISGLLAIGPSLKNFGPEANQVAENMASDYIHKFLPGTENVQLTYYTQNEFKLVKHHMKNRDFGEAINILMELYETIDPKKLHKVAHNLSVAYEAMGDLRAARYWQDRAVR